MKKITFILFTVLFVSSFGAEAKVPEEQKTLSEDQRQLNYGYALTYQTAKGFQKLNTLMAIKLESKDTHAFIKDLVDTCKKIQDQLDEFKKTYPNLNFEDTGKPKVMEIKSKDQKRDRIDEFLPIVGKTGKDFDRSLILFVSFSLNEIKYIVQALTDLEKNESLNKFDKETFNQFLRLEDRSIKLLNERYFKNNYYKSQSDDKK
jgi:hypothetical protein